MDLSTYKNIIKNTVALDMPNYLKQRLINDIKKNKIAKDGSKEIEGIINLKGMQGQLEKISTCIDKNNLTLKLLDLLEIKKGYKYSILFQYLEIDFSEFKNKIDTFAVDINSDYYNYENEVNNDEIQYYDDEKTFIIKFHKYIEVIDKDVVEKKYLRYPIIFVFHKGFNLFEVRFDRLSFNNNNDFYFNTMLARLNTITGIYNFIYSYFNVEETIKEIVNNHKEIVEQIIWSFETAKSKGLTLRVGEDGIMPFLGELEIIVKDLSNKYHEDKNVVECLKEIEGYMNSTKRFANEKFRILSWLKYEDNGNNVKLDKTIDLKITFDYYKKGFALLNIYENEINDMERINHVIRFIGKIAEGIGKL